MKTRKNIYFKVVALAAIAIAFARQWICEYRLAVQCSAK